VKESVRIFDTKYNRENGELSHGNTINTKEKTP
jgi:hypothetical protein